MLLLLALRVCIVIRSCWHACRSLVWCHTSLHEPQLTEMCMLLLLLM